MKLSNEKIYSKRQATWLGSWQRIIAQLLVSLWSHITISFVRLDAKATHQYFSTLYSGRPDPLLFDGKDGRYLDQILLVMEPGKITGKICIDCGSGDGSLQKWLINRGIDFSHYIGIDFAHPDLIISTNSKIVNDSVENIKRVDLEQALVFCVNLLCYLDDEALNRLLRNLESVDKLIIIEPVPGLFWDAYFEKVKIYYRTKAKLYDFLQMRGWEIERCASDYAVSISSFHFIELSHTFVASHKQFKI